MAPTSVPATRALADCSRRSIWIAATLALACIAPRVSAAPVRAAYAYDYMPPSHVDSLAAAGLNRVLIHWLPDSLDAGGRTRLRAWVDRGVATGVDVVPEWLLQQKSRLAARPAGRRYVWGRAVRESTAACPLDSAYWRSALLDRAEEFLAADPRVRRLAVDLELLGAARHHYDAGACHCAVCIASYAHGRAEILSRDPSRLSGLLPYEEARLARILGALVAEFSARHPGVELGVLDLDLDSFVHRALARALSRTGVPTADYSEKSYTPGASALAATRTKLGRLGLRDAPLVGGLWLKRWTPATLQDAVRGVVSAADGYFVFTTYSLWQSPARLDGPYLLQGAPGDYWRALREANATP
jgi:hypothetical protein